MSGREDYDLIEAIGKIQESPLIEKIRLLILTISRKRNHKLSNGRDRIKTLIEKQKQLNNLGKELASENAMGWVMSGQIDIQHIKLSGILRLGDTVFDNLIKSKEFLVYSSNKLFTIGKNNSKENKGYFLSYKGKNFELGESEDLITLEDDFLKRNNNQIKKFQIENLDRLSKEYERLKEEILLLKDSINKEFSMEEFIHDYIFALHNDKMVKKDLSNYGEINLLEENLTEKIEPKQINFSSAKNSVLEELVDEAGYKYKKKFEGFIMMCGRVYGLPLMGTISKFLGKKEIDLSNTYYLDSIGNFNKEYKKMLSEEIKRKTKQNFSSEVAKINTSKEKIKYLDSKRKRVIPNKQESIGFSKVTDHEYIIFKELSKFIVKKWERYYLFPEVSVGIRIINREKNLSFERSCFIYEPSYYTHPFVRSSRTICLREENRDKVLGIKKSSYDIKNLDKKEFAESVLKYLNCAKSVLTKGFMGNPGFDNSDAFLGKEIKLDEAWKLKSCGVIIHDND